MHQPPLATGAGGGPVVLLAGGAVVVVPVVVVAPAVEVGTDVSVRWADVVVDGAMVV